MKYEEEEARQRGIALLSGAIATLEEALEDFTPENGGHPSEYNGICTAEMILRRVVDGE